MKSKTLKEFFERYSSNPTLDRKVWRQGRVDWAVFKKYPRDYHVDKNFIKSHVNNGEMSGKIHKGERKIRLNRDYIIEIQP